MFSVKDTGIGIPNNKRHRLFSAFSQIDASTTRKFGGTGLGLAISKRFAELMGGGIGFESELGKGSCFWFTVPVTKQTGTKPWDAEIAVFSKHRIIAVESSPLGRQILQARLESLSCPHTIVPTAADLWNQLALAAENKNPYSIAVLDMLMSDEDCSQLVTDIRAHPDVKAMKLVMLVPIMRKDYLSRFAEIGFDAYLSKPIRRSQLVNCLSDVLTPEKKRTLPVVQIAATGNTAKRPSVLLAEDNLVNQKVAAGIFRKLGCQIEIVSNGQEAVETLKAHRFDIVMMDIQMPVMDGYEATATIRNCTSTVLDHTIPIIAMTAHAFKSDLEKCISSGMNDYVTKPVTPKALMDVLEKWLPQASGNQTPDPENKKATAVEQQNPSEIWDEAGMLERLMDDEELAATVLDEFLVDMPNQIEILRNDLAAGNIAGARQQTHTIKGAAANVGGKILYAIATEMEQDGRAGNVENMKACMNKLDAAYKAFKQYSDEKRKVPTRP